MSERVDNGGPAFPGPMKPDVYLGMSLRDYFAGQALSGLLSTMAVAHPFYEMSTLRMARLSYSYADAMLRARITQEEALIEIARLGQEYDKG